MPEPGADANETVAMKQKSLVATRLGKTNQRTRMFSGHIAVG
jgi:hypothetical protein